MPHPFWSSARTAVAVAVAALAITGCGSSGDSGKTNTAAQSGDSRPRVEGMWRLVYTPQAGNQHEERYTWQTTPECPAGACSFRVQSRTGNHFRFHFDHALGDYRRKFEDHADCIDLSTGQVLVSDGYTTHSIEDLQVTNSVISDADGVDYATEMSGTEDDQNQLTSEAEAAGCSAKADHYTIQAVRFDKPTGKPGSAAPPQSGGGAATATGAAGE